MYHLSGLSYRGCGTWRPRHSGSSLCSCCLLHDNHSFLLSMLSPTSSCSWLYPRGLGGNGFQWHGWNKFGRFRNLPTEFLNVLCLFRLLFFCWSADFHSILCKCMFFVWRVTLASVGGRVLSSGGFFFFRKMSYLASTIHFCFSWP